MLCENLILEMDWEENIQNDVGILTMWLSPAKPEIPRRGGACTAELHDHVDIEGIKHARKSSKTSASMSN